MFSQIQAYLRKSASRGRTVERVGPFIVTITPDENNPYLNYAIPDDGAEPTPADVEALIECFGRHKRAPRLEFIPQNAPAVEAALQAYGFTSEGEVPLMIHDATAPISELVIADGIEFIIPDADDDFMGMMRAQGEAFGGDATPPSSGAVAFQRDFLDQGGISVFARHIESRDPVGGGMCDVPHDKTSELVGVGVRDSYRRKGIAAAMTHWLAQRAVAAGTTTIFLMAASPNEARIYERAGFKTVGEMLHTSKKT